jgi:hypothetical protein
MKMAASKGIQNSFRIKKTTMARLRRVPIIKEGGEILRAILAPWPSFSRAGRRK